MDISTVDLKKILTIEYLMNVTKIEKNDESTNQNVYIIYTTLEKYVVKIYKELKHVESMIKVHEYLYENNIYVPNIVINKKEKGFSILNNNYIIVYTFLNGTQLGKTYKKIPNEIIKKLANQVRRMHDITHDIEKYNLDKVPFTIDKKFDRNSLLHFDLTKMNIFLNNEKIGFIDFDDAKVGPSVYDVAILCSLLFFTKSSGVDKNGCRLFIETYYEKDRELMKNETKYIKEISIKWIDYIMSNNLFDTSLKSSFEIKKQLIIKSMDVVMLWK